MNERFRRMATIAGASLFLVSTTGFAQDTSVAPPPTTGPGAVVPFDTTAGANLAGPTTLADTAVDDDDDRDFPWGLLGLLGLLGLMKRGGGTVVTRDTYTPPADTRPRNVGTGSADDRTMNLNPRPPGTNDPRR